MQPVIPIHCPSLSTLSHFQPHVGASHNLSIDCLAASFSLLSPLYLRRLQEEVDYRKQIALFCAGAGNPPACDSQCTNCTQACLNKEKKMIKILQHARVKDTAMRNLSCTIGKALFLCHLTEMQNIYGITTRKS